MQQNRKFIMVIAGILLVSTLTMAGSLYAVTHSYGTPKPFDQDSVAGAIVDNVAIEGDDAPTSQQALRQKFDAMSRVDPETNTLTVITEAYLTAYWQQDGETGKVRSLTADEVLYLIQDSITLYFSGSYTQLVFPAFGTEAARIFTGPGEDSQANLQAIYDLIVHRMTLLSSPEVWIPNMERTVYVPSYEPGNGFFLERLFSGAMNTTAYDHLVPDHFAFDGSQIEYYCTADAGMRPAYVISYPTLEMGQ